MCILVRTGKEGQRKRKSTILLGRMNNCLKREWSQSIWLPA